jgi:hypothetical protein
VFLKNEKRRLMEKKEKLEARVLRGTGLFQEPDSDLRDLFDLKTSGKEAFLLACYGCGLGHAYYLYEEDRFLGPPPEECMFPLVPLTIVDSKQFPPKDANHQPAGTLLRRNPALLSKILEDDKYLLLIDSEAYLDNVVIINRKIWPFGRLDVPHVEFSPLPWGRRLEPSVIDAAKRVFISDYYRDNIIAQYRRNVLDIRQEAKRRGIDPVDILVVDGRITRTTEGFLTPYLAGVKLRENNYLVAGCRFAGSSFHPNGELFAYRGKDFGSGAFLIGLVGGLEEIKSGESEPINAVVEDEAQERICHSNHGICQVQRYVAGSAGFFGKGYVAAPLADESQIREAINGGVGIITFNKNGDIVFHDCEGKPSQQQDELAQNVKNLAYLARKGFLKTFKPKR